jgi:hypothetical protein
MRQSGASAIASISARKRHAPLRSGDVGSYPSGWNQSQMSRLQKAVMMSYSKLDVARVRRNLNIQQYVTSHYGSNGSPERVPVNFLELAIGIYTYQLVARVPQVTVTAKSLSLRPVVANFEIVMNGMLKDQLGLAVALREVVKDAMFGVGLMKVGKSPATQVDIDGGTYSVGQPFADPISLDDWFHDISAKRWSLCRFCGNRYSVPIEDLRDSELFDQSAVAELQPDTRRTQNVTGEEKASSISVDSGSTPDDWKDCVELSDTWIPSERIVLTCKADDDTGKAPLRVVEWRGPGRGPYHMLGFNDVPDNILPLPPATLLSDLNELANRLFRKLGRQAERQKTITAVQRGGEEDGQRIVNASDGETISVDNPQNVTQLKFGGVEGNTLAFTLQVKDLIAYMGGNLDTLGGLSPQADTLGQEQILGQNASKRMASMQMRTHEFTENVIQDVGYYVWTDPLQDYPLDRTIPGTDITISTALRPEQRTEDFFNMAVTIEPYSMTESTPASKLNAIGRIVQDFIVPLLPMWQAQGISLDGRGLLTTVAKYSHVADLGAFVRFSDPQEQQGGQGGGAPESAAPAFTRHVSERVSRPGSTRAGKDAALMQALVTGGGMQGSEAAAIGRPTG